MSFITIRDSVMQKMRLRFKRNVNTETPMLTEHILQPLAILDMAYGTLQEIGSSVSHAQKKQYNRIIDYYSRHIFGRYTGFLYGGLSDDDVALFNKYMDKISECTKHDMDILYYQVQAHIMDVPCSERDVLTKILISEILCLLSYDSICISAKRKINHINTLAKMTKDLSSYIYAKYYKKDVSFQDKTFEDTLTVLFRHIAQVDLNGI